MRQWKDSQTYQAEVPLANNQGKEGGKLLLRYTLQQQFHQDLKSLHTLTPGWSTSVVLGRGPCRLGKTTSGWSLPPVACSGLRPVLELVACSRRTCRAVSLLLLPSCLPHFLVSETTGWCPYVTTRLAVRAMLQAHI